MAFGDRWLKQELSLSFPPPSDGEMAPKRLETTLEIEILVDAMIISAVVHLTKGPVLVSGGREIAR